MNSREWNPQRLDVEAFARHEGCLEGQWPLQDLTRLTESAHPQVPAQPSDVISWSALGSTRDVRGGVQQVWLRVQASVRMALVCQRCLAPVETTLQVDRAFHFVLGEDAAAELDSGSEDDVLALTNSLKMIELIEDELLLALPLVPKHEICPVALPTSAGEIDDAPQHQPFAALAALKRGGSAH